MLKKRLSRDLDRLDYNCSNSFFLRKGFSKKGQITIFIIIGILLLLALLLVVFLRSETFIFRPEEIIPTEKGKIENYISSCISSIGEEALFKIGLQGGYINIPSEILKDQNLYLKTSSITAVPYWAYGPTVRMPSLLQIKDRIDTYVEENLRNCVFGMNVFQETYDINEKSKLLADTSITDSQVVFKVHWFLEIKDKAGEVITELLEHDAVSPVQLKKVYETSARIVDNEMNSLKLEDLTQDLIALEHQNVPVAGMEISCSKKVWDVKKTEETILEMLRINLRELKVAGTDLIEFPKELTYYQNHYIWNLGDDFSNPEVSVVFNFDQNYPYTFAVTPRSGSKLKSSQLGGNDLLSFLCIQMWKFTYDLKFPVLVRVRDETTGYNFYFSFTVHLIRNTPNRNEVSARSSNVVDTVTDEDYCKIKNVPMMVYTYELVDNDKGVYVREPLDQVNTSFTCIKYKCEMGQTEYNYGGRGDVSAYFKNFPYCVGGILRGTKEGYKEEWIRVVTSSGKEVELNLEPLFAFPVKNIKVVKHELSSTNGVNLMVGSEEKLGADEQAFVKLVFNKDKAASIGEPFYEDNFVISSSLSPEGDEKWVNFLGKADFGYDLEISLFEDDQLIGGYKGSWNPSWSELENADEIIIHVLSKESSSEEELFEFITDLEKNSPLIPLPEIN